MPDTFGFYGNRFFILLAFSFLSWNFAFKLFLRYFPTRLRTLFFLDGSLRIAVLSNPRRTLRIAASNSNRLFVEVEQLLLAHPTFDTFGFQTLWTFLIVEVAITFGTHPMFDIRFLHFPKRLIVEVEQFGHTSKFDTFGLR